VELLEGTASNAVMRGDRPVESSAAPISCTAWSRAETEVLRSEA
jgi:hypothetical protein